MACVLTDIFSRTRAKSLERIPGTCERVVGFRRLEPGLNAVRAGAPPAKD